LGYHTQSRRNRPRIYHTTGVTKAEITELCARIEAREFSPRVRRWPPILGLRDALTVTLTYLRRNRVQAEIAENYGVSQPTISRAISAITPLLVQALLDHVPTAGELDVGTCYIVDGTPFRKPEGGDLLDWQKEFNKQINKIRYVIEQVIANFKTWRIMHTDYRRPLATFPETISVVVALHFYTTA
jgi:Helix-turn-helix of DDE superfamily endonuclease/DDE superfamily endonuclease